MRRTLATAVACALALAGVSCATNPASGTRHVVFTTVKSEQEQARRAHEEIQRSYGLYQDQAVQDYVQMIGTRVARNTPIADWDFKFFVLDDDEINAFTTGGGYVYVHRGLLTYLNSEAELAAVLGHEIGHDVARHPARSEAQRVLLGSGAIATAILTGNYALAEMADLGAAAWYQGYGREHESEADRLGLEYAARAGYRPTAMGDTMRMFKAQEAFEINRAKDEGRDPKIYHGVFSDHPAPDERVVEATLGERPEKKSPREFLLWRLRGASVSHGDTLAVHGMEGYALITRSGSPLDGGEGPVRWAVLYRGTQAFVIGAASRSSENYAPLDDGVFMSSIETMRDMKPAEYPLAEPYRIKIITADEKTKLEDYSKDVPVEKFKLEELRLMNALYPKGEPKPGDLVKVVE